MGEEMKARKDHSICSSKHRAISGACSPTEEDQIDRSVYIPSSHVAHQADQMLDPILRKQALTNLAIARRSSCHMKANIVRGPSNKWGHCSLKHCSSGHSKMRCLSSPTVPVAQRWQILSNLGTRGLAHEPSSLGRR